ncbi:MAG: hypothetical protein AUG74_01725 [Bacteroidetes bacterium 13_1_20CM_4_60_6]|nr:MAG: hypothetical protein AUG74_01725 [Bacteroidetes bacterium 13_1_20CM_4_60_6]
MDYFVPDWNDVVDPWFNFPLDKPSGEHLRDPAKTDVRAHELFPLGEIPYDGILVSRMTFAPGAGVLQKAREASLRLRFRLPDELLLMADCGAWGYVDRDEPPFDSEEILDFYADGGFDYGVSIDHMIVDSIIEDDITRPLTKEEKERRWDITVENGKEILNLSRKRHLNGKPRLVGAIQGWNEESYVRAAEQLLGEGYDFIGIGGLARAPTSGILRVAAAVSRSIQSYGRRSGRRIDLHIFGITRMKVVSELARLGVTSFDSASLLRKAWLSKDENYYLDDKTAYAAVRIPHSSRSTRIRARLASGEMKSERLHDLETDALAAARNYALGEVDLEMAVSAIAKYDFAALGLRGDIRRDLRRTLRAKPWEQCACPLCCKIGVEIILHRGNDRNRRRGFHNLWVFHKYLRKLVPRILVLTNCTQKKHGRRSDLPAYLRYSKSDTFQLWWKNLREVRGIDLGVLSAEHGVVPWWKPIPNYNKRIEELSQEEKLRLEKKVSMVLLRYDLVFFSGLGEYGRMMRKLALSANPRVELFPKKELSSRKLDLLELKRQIPDMRGAVLKAVSASGGRGLDLF